MLVEALLRQRQDGMQISNGNCHVDAWSSAETALPGTETHTGGATKMGASCQNWWAALKKEYCEVKNLCELSGFGWDNIQNLVTANNNVWDSLLTVHPKLKKWCTISFPLFDEMADLIEGTYATGAGVYLPSHDFTPSDDDSDREEDAIDPFL
ncbi:hypothetical protein BDQ12DRAFT_723607 [Crucibulum laeve]|uniref:Myb/SANT-like domain-containing protein n=1 Tax=Crucibulum laeve TaxID=68775 RepID=A0A5C3LYS8_9AGAR|nr:hypothetical protein BDQ12DRAFT_723607 [Crucibulum laeve]